MFKLIHYLITHYSAMPVWVREPFIFFKVIVCGEEGPWELGLWYRWLLNRIRHQTHLPVTRLLVWSPDNPVER